MVSSGEYLSAHVIKGSERIYIPKNTKQNKNIRNKIIFIKYEVAMSILREENKTNMQNR